MYPTYSSIFIEPVVLQLPFEGKMKIYPHIFHAETSADSNPLYVRSVCVSICLSIHGHTSDPNPIKLCMASSFGSGMVVG